MHLDKLQISSTIGSFLFFAFVFELVRKRKIKEEYSLLWLFFAGLFIFIALFRESMDIVSYLVGIAYPPATLFLFLILGLLSIVIHFSIVISGLAEKVKTLVQELGLLKLQIQIYEQETESKQKLYLDQ